SSSIKNVVVGENRASDPDFSLCAKLLRSSKIDDLEFVRLDLDGISIPFTISIIARARNYLRIRLLDQPLSIHSAAFITTLFSLSIGHVFLNNPNSRIHPDSFIGLPRAFWEKFLNEQLSNGSIEWIATANTRRRVTKAPINLPSSSIKWLEWQKVQK
ncbi:hypothetical protein PMAYCL1PPCAC_08387, partial [Pristionchus mayeri]